MIERCPALRSLHSQTAVNGVRCGAGVWSRRGVVVAMVWNAFSDGEKAADGAVRQNRLYTENELRA